MKMRLLLVSGITNALLLMYVLLSFLSSDSLVKEGVESGKKIFRVGILTPITHPALEEIEAGFKDQLASDKVSCSFTTYNANGNPVLLRAQAEELLNQRYDLIFSIATNPTVILHELALKKQSKTPIIFAAVGDPIGLGMVQSYEHPGGYITGATEENNYEKQLSLMFQIKPIVKKMLFLYDPTQRGGQEKDKDLIVSLLTQRGIEALVVEVFNAQEIGYKIKSLMHEVDAVMVLKDNTVVSALDMVIKQCEQHATTLFVSDLDSVKKGAAVGFGVHEKSFGIRAAQQAKQVLAEGKNIADVPVAIVDEFKVSLNKTALKKQNVIIPQGLLALFEAIEVV